MAIKRCDIIDGPSKLDLLIDLIGEDDSRYGRPRLRLFQIEKPVKKSRLPEETRYNVSIKAVRKGYWNVAKDWCYYLEGDTWENGYAVGSFAAVYWPQTRKGFLLVGGDYELKVRKPENVISNGKQIGTISELEPFEGFLSIPQS